MVENHIFDPKQIEVLESKDRKKWLNQKNIKEREFLGVMTV